MQSEIQRSEFVGTPHVIISPASLHRDKSLLDKLAEIPRAAPIRLHVLEVTAPDAASLIAAVLDKTLVEAGSSPLQTAAT